MRKIQEENRTDAVIAATAYADAMDIMTDSTLGHPFLRKSTLTNPTGWPF